MPNNSWDNLSKGIVISISTILMTMVGVSVVASYDAVKASHQVKIENIRLEGDVKEHIAAQIQHNKSVEEKQILHNKSVEEKLCEIRINTKAINEKLMDQRIMLEGLLK